MPTEEKIDYSKCVGRYNPESGKVEWTPKDRSIPENKAPAVEGIKEIVASGLPGRPVFTSRKSYEKAVRDAGYVVVGNESAAAPPAHSIDRINRTMAYKNERGHK